MSPLIGTAGGFGLVWNKEVAVDIIYYDKNIINCWISSKYSYICWLCYAIYSPSRSDDRTSFWQRVVETRENLPSPWLIIRDMNGTLSHAERYSTGGALLGICLPMLLLRQSTIWGSLIWGCYSIKLLLVC